MNSKFVQCIFWGLLLIGFGIFSCATYPTSTTQVTPSSQNVKPTKSRKKPLPKVQYFADLLNDGNFKKIELSEGPIPMQGNDQWLRDFYGSIKYPALARENSIQGIVILNVLINKMGKVESVTIKKRLSDDCDQEAKRAFIASTKKGYSPLLVEGKPVNFKMEMPVGFWLG